MRFILIFRSYFKTPHVIPAKAGILLVYLAASLFSSVVLWGGDLPQDDVVGHLRQYLPDQTTYRGPLGTRHLFEVKTQSFEEVKKYLEAKQIRFFGKAMVVQNIPLAATVSEKSDYRRLFGRTPDGWGVTLESKKYLPKEQKWVDTVLIFFTLPDETTATKPPAKPRPVAAPKEDAQKTTP